MCAIAAGRGGGAAASPRYCSVTKTLCCWTRTHLSCAGLVARSRNAKSPKPTVVLIKSINHVAGSQDYELQAPYCNRIIFFKLVTYPPPEAEITWIIIYSLVQFLPSRNCIKLFFHAVGCELNIYHGMCLFDYLLFVCAVCLRCYAGGQQCCLLVLPLPCVHR